MRLVNYILSTILITASTAAISGEIPEYVLELAAKANIYEVQITTAKIKSITKGGDKITIEFDGYAEIGSQKTQHMVEEAIHFQPRKEGEVRLIDLPEDSKEIRIYWGYGVGNFSKILAFEKIR